MLLPTSHSWTKPKDGQLKEAVILLMNMLDEMLTALYWMGMVTIPIICLVVSHAFFHMEKGGMK